jgi:site-specific DNA-adenine methylase
MFRDLSSTAEFREPFLGSGAVALSFFRTRPGRCAWLNDGDAALAALWVSVLHRSKSLTRMISGFSEVMSANDFFYFQKILR